MTAFRRMLALGENRMEWVELSQLLTTGVKEYDTINSKLAGYHNPTMLG